MCIRDRGYDTKKIAVADVELFKLVTLIEASNVMDDVVVVDFGKMCIRDSGGAGREAHPNWSFHSCIL